MTKTLTIIDGYGFLFRAYYVLPGLSTTSGLPIGGVYGFINMLLKYLTGYLVIAFDTGKKNFRHEIYHGYKANRQKPPEDLIPQFAILREAVSAFNLNCEEVIGYEADDVIATLAKTHSKYDDLKITVITADKDLFQLIDEKISVFDPMKNKYITEEDVIAKFGVGPDKLLDLLALTGDASDNIPGVLGIGVKTAAKLLTEFGSLENILENAHQIKQNKCREAILAYKEWALLSKQLVSLATTVEIEGDLEKYRIKAPDIQKLTNFLKKYEFKSLIPRVQKLFSHEIQIHNEKNIVEYSNENLLVFLDRCKSEGKMALYLHEESKTLSIAYSENNLFCIEQDNIEPSLKLLSPILISKEVLKIVYNTKDLRKFLPEIDVVDDVMIMSYSIDTGKHDHKLETIIKYNLDIEVTESSAQALILLHNKLKQKLLSQRLFTIYERCERRLERVLADIEKQGILVDAEVLKELSEDFSKKITLLEKEIYELAGEEFNIGSPKQLSHILFDKLSLDKGKKAKSGIYSTNVEVLEELAADGQKIANKVLSWRHFSKLKNTYTDALIGQINSSTKRIHTNYSMVATATGRLSSNNPNLQNIPIRSEEGNAIRKAFIAPEGYKIIAADYSQIELRLIAHIANVLAFKNAFAEGKDIHAITAKQIFGMEEKNLSESLRRKAKSINFGIIYGISPFGLAKQLGITKNEAAEFIDHYFSCYPEIKVYMEEMKLYAKSHGYVKTLFGRYCFIQNVNSKIAHLRQFAERAAINFPLQGTAADVIKKAMVRLFDRLKTGKIILQVHDELIVETAEAHVFDVAKLMQEVMENVINVPLKIEVKVGNSWGSMEKITNLI
ncbi:MAG: DNA polymerase I [Candidatus Mesenet longicola]|uniref:DNA polymerase I n=1 Tax=Candidatus Mesenet longicola TaxID=1892558 RepID=A0A8J3HVG2_9RICK|nr:MAG: DNA polymerase I [Candidatus Mesenet longicola]GHM59650.1 MAG: DNA polymerase I [Candidatus Mesenet longicola]